MVLHVRVLPERKSRGTCCHILARVLVMTPKGAIPQSQTSNDTENSQKDHNKITITILQTEACKVTEDTYTETVTPEQRWTRRQHPIRVQTIDP